MRKRVKDLAYALNTNKSELIDIANQLDLDESKLYHSFTQPKGEHKGVPQFRTIDAPGKKLKKLQRKILSSVLYESSLPEYFFGGVKGKDGVLNARYHQGNKYFFLTDMKSFYPSVKDTDVSLVLIKEGFYPEVANLLARLCTRRGSLPQGCPTSSFLASLVVYHSCGDLFQSYMDRGLKVSVYVDDITMSGPTDFKSDVQDIISEIRGRGMKINFEKTHYCTKNPKVTGILMKNNGIVAMPYTYDRSQDDTIPEPSRVGHLQRIEYVNRIAKQKSSSQAD